MPALCADNMIHRSQEVRAMCITQLLFSVPIKLANTLLGKVFETSNYNQFIRSHYQERFTMRHFMCIAIAITFCGAAFGQQAGHNKPEVHPPLIIQSCTKSGGCQTESKSVVVGANWRWTHSMSGYQNCYTGNTWDSSLCPDGVTCAQNCALDGADYQGTYGVSTSGSSIKLNFVTHGPYSTNIGSRLYLLDSETEYKLFKLKNKEFTFDVDVSKLPCGLNGALYLVDMDADGGMSKYSGNKAGAKYGTGYCDAQCPHDLKFINGEANVKTWTPSKSDKNSGTGHYGSCCNEMDIWESNRISTAYTPHVCSVREQMRCEGSDCGDNASGQRHAGVCDKDGCDFNPYRMDDKYFFGPSSNYTIDSTKPFTVITQFITSDGTDNGDLSEIRRLWVQNGKLVQSNYVTVGGQRYNSITEEFCKAQKTEFGNSNDYAKRGGHKAMSQSLEHGMVLVMSLWDDHDVHMLWLDSNYPTDKSPSSPGVARGTCPTTSGVPSDVESGYPDASVRYFNIKYGEINSTYTN